LHNHFIINALQNLLIDIAKQPLSQCQIEITVFQRNYLYKIKAISMRWLKVLWIIGKLEFLHDTLFFLLC